MSRTKPPAPSDFFTADQLCRRWDATPDDLAAVIRSGQLRRAWVPPTDHPALRNHTFHVVKLADLPPEVAAEILQQPQHFVWIPSDSTDPRQSVWDMVGRPSQDRHRESSETMYRKLFTAVTGRRPGDQWPNIDLPGPCAIFETSANLQVYDAPDFIYQGAPAFERRPGDAPEVLVFADRDGGEVLLIARDTARAPDDAGVLGKFDSVLPLPLSRAVFPASDVQALEKAQSGRPSAQPEKRITLDEQRHAWLVDRLKAKGYTLPIPRSRGGAPGIKAEVRAEAEAECFDLFRGTGFDRAWKALPKSD